jgi:hypothetical protein
MAVAGCKCQVAGKGLCHEQGGLANLAGQAAGGSHGLCGQRGMTCRIACAAYNSVIGADSQSTSEQAAGFHSKAQPL